MAKVDLNNILESIRSTLAASNTTTATYDLSASLTTRVQKVLKVNPIQIPLQPSFYPFVTCHVVSKDVVGQDIAASQINAKRRAVVEVDVVGAVWNPNFVDDTEDPAAEDINYLMENVEQILRTIPNVSGYVTWQAPNGIAFDGAQIDEQTHLRAGVLTMKGTVFY